jgi:putative hemolysin
MRIAYDGKGMTSPLRAKEFSYATPDDAPWRRALIQGIEQVTGKPKLWRLYERYRHDGRSEDFFAEAVSRLDFRLRVSSAQEPAFPAEGPLVVLANHPFGVVDGILLGYLISRVRPDFRILVHSALYRLPELRNNLLPIDFSGTAEALQTNLTSRRAALEDLAQGRAIAIFPAGGVSTAPRILDAAIDAPWTPFLARLIHCGRASVVPVYFEGQNSRLFQLTSRLAMGLRPSLLFREVVKKIGHEIGAHIGAPLPYESLAPITDRRLLTDYLRQRTYALRASALAEGAGD